MTNKKCENDYQKVFAFRENVKSFLTQRFSKKSFLELLK